MLSVRLHFCEGILFLFHYQPTHNNQPQSCLHHLPHPRTGAVNPTTSHLHAVIYIHPPQSHTPVLFQRIASPIQPIQSYRATLLPAHVLPVRRCPDAMSIPPQAMADHTMVVCYTFCRFHRADCRRRYSRKQPRHC